MINSVPLSLPYIYPQMNPQIQQEHNNQIEKTLGYVQNRLIRSISANNPFVNYPLYPNDVGNFCYNYPNSLFYYRPIRYFFQRPVQLDEDNCFPHQKKVLDQLVSRDNKIRSMLENKTVKYGIPKKIEDVLKNGEIVHYPTSTVVSAADLKKKQEEYNKLVEKIEKLGPEGQRRIRKRNNEIRNIMKKIVFFNDFCLDLRSFSIASKNLKKNNFTYVQATKANINEIKNFILRILSNLESFCVKFLGEKINLSSRDAKVRENSVFVVKSFVHQLFNDLSSAFVQKNDIPEGIKTLFKTYIKEKSTLSPGFLTTFEFNRLEFDINCRLNNMTLERQALIIGFLILYRVLLIDVFKNYLNYFPKIREMGNPVSELLDQQIKGKSPSRRKSKLILNNGRTPKKISNMGTLSSNKNDDQLNIIEGMTGKNADTKLLYYKKKKINIRNNLQYNFNFLIQVLHNIFRKSFENSPQKYKDYYKKSKLYGLMVYSTEENFNKVYDGKNDDIEIMNGIYDVDGEAIDFLKENARWTHMYQLNTLQFCTDFAKLIMEGDNNFRPSDLESQRSKSIKSKINTNNEGGDNNDEDE